MDAAHAAFARADALFYDKPGRRDTDSSARFEVPDSRDWTLWTRVDDDHWTHWLPRTAGLPDQGWKIHVSVVPATAAATLDAVAAFCHHHLLAFKHVRSRLHLGFSLAKDADRGAAGKFITVYGGVMIRSKKGELVGAIGVTGDTGENDEKIAVAAIEACGFKADLS